MSSAGRTGNWLDDLAIHEFMDSTKAAFPDLRHRLILHNADLGPELTARVFPNRSDARAVAVRHVTEDLGRAPTLAEWLADCELTRLPQPLARRFPLDPVQLTEQLADSQRLRDTELPRAVLDLLLLPERLAGQVALPILLNGFGPTLARAVFGPPREVYSSTGTRAVFDAAYIAEAVIHWVFGMIPSVQDVASSLNRRRAAGHGVA